MNPHKTYFDPRDPKFDQSLHWLVMLAGLPPSDRDVFELLERSDKVLAVDGGASILLRMGVKPDIAIGDFDSIRKEDLDLLKKLGVPLLSFEVDKDYTDLELGLQFLLRIKAGIVRILGASDGHPDHHLANYLALSSEAFLDLNLEIFSPPFRSFLVREEVPITISGQPGDMISVIPLSDEVDIQTFSGVKWPVNNLLVKRGEGKTLRNQLVTPSASLLFSKGRAIVVHRYC